MPELPEVETVCRGLEPVMMGQVITRIDTHRAGLRVPFPEALSENVAGARVLRIARRAKYILIHLNNGMVLVIHLGMSGRMTVEEAGFKPARHDHMVIHLKDKRMVAFNDARRFGVVDLVEEGAMESHALFRHLGPEPLSNEFSGPALAAKLKGKKTSVKVAIMDQRVVVGVGNIYASEALFLSGISPKRLAGQVQGERAEALVRAIRKVLQKAIRAGGSSLRDYRQADGELGYFQHQFTVYNREGQACPGCTCDIAKTKGILRITQGGRSSFYCPRKQK
ncbi:MAG: 5-hydroxymethyluracil glycosylase [Micavibrio sp.]|nr:5-hydroxymethyluracil glycosylase [Micavibrio sp.]